MPARSIHAVVAVSVSFLGFASHSLAGSVAENSHNLGALRNALQTDAVDVHVVSDSIGLANEKRYTTAIAWIIHSLTGELPTRIGAGAGDHSTRRRFGMGIRSRTTPEFFGINTQQSDPYLMTDGRAPLVLAGQGAEMPHDGTHTYGTMNGRTGTVGLILANASSNSTTGGAFVNVITPGLDNRVIADLYVQAGDLGLPDRDFIVQDFNRNGPTLATFNPSADIAGYRHLGEDPTAPRGGAVTGMIGRILPEFRITGQISANETLRAVVSDVERTNAGSNDPVDDGTNLTFAGQVMSRADENWQWVGGTALYHHGGNSWQLDDWATSMSPTAPEPKRFTDEQWLHAMDAWTRDASRRSVYILCLASENGSSVEEVRDDAVAMMDRFTAADLAIGKPEPIFALIQWHRQGNLDEQTQRDWYAGYELAAMTRPNAASLDLAGLLDYTVFDGSPDAQQYLADNGLTSVTFGAVTNADISHADLVDDGVHQSDEASNVFFAQRVALALASLDCPGDCDGDGTVAFGDLIAILGEFGNASAGPCDADGSGAVNFGDLVAALALFGPCE